jgi:hypothetical protein
MIIAVVKSALRGFASYLVAVDFAFSFDFAALA